MRPTRVVYLCIGLGLAFACAAALSATTYTVTTTADAGAGSLRQALTDATGAAGPHTIAFNIPGTGPHTIALASDLPNVNVDAGLTIDWTTQPGFAGTPQIEIHHDGTFSSQCLRFLLTPITIKAFPPGHRSIGHGGPGQRHRSQFDQRLRSERHRRAELQ